MFSLFAISDSTKNFYKTNSSIDVSTDAQF